MVEEKVGGKKEAETAKKKQVAKKDKKGAKLGVVGAGANVAGLVVVYLAVNTGRTFYSIFYPTFPEHWQLTPNLIEDKQPLVLDLLVSNDKSAPRDALLKSMYSYDFTYDYYAPVRKTFTHLVKVDMARVKKIRNTYVHAFISKRKENGDKMVLGHGSGTVIKYISPPPMKRKFLLLTGAECPQEAEESYGPEDKKKIARGAPFVHVRLVQDELSYPRQMVRMQRDDRGRDGYIPEVFVDEAWMTDDQLIKFNESGNEFTAEITFDLMSGGRWRFQNHMMRSLKMNAEMFGEDSEEMLQFRDLIANTNTKLLLATFVVSFLHMIFEILAFKSDVHFWRSTDPDTLNKYISVRSIFLNIICELVICVYLYDQGANIVIVLLQAASLTIEAWKITRAMTVELGLGFGFIPYPRFVSKGKKQFGDTDKKAIIYLSALLLPVCIGYGLYSMQMDCHPSWYSYSIQTAATLVYSLGLILMTPQLFLNYKNKSVAFLPWKRFIYRALNTFIDDLFAFIVKMPTMHRLSVFRDDAVFLIYLYQRWIYPVDEGRLYDEDDAEDDDDDDVANGAEVEGKGEDGADGDGLRERKVASSNDAAGTKTQNIPQKERKKQK